MKRKPFKFRIRVSPGRHILVSVCETKELMWHEMEAQEGQKHKHDLACTIFPPGTTDRGCIAKIFFFWRGLRVPIIAHEAAHAAQNICAVLKEPADLVDDEAHATWVEKIVEKVIERTAKAPL